MQSFITKGINVVNAPRFLSSKRCLLQNIVHPGTDTMPLYPKNVLLKWLDKPDCVKMISSTSSEISINRGNILAINLRISQSYFEKYRLEISHNGAENLYEDIFYINNKNRFRIIWDTLQNHYDNYKFRFTERCISGLYPQVTNEYEINVELKDNSVNAEYLFSDSDDDALLSIGMI